MFFVYYYRRIYTRPNRSALPIAVAAPIYASDFHDCSSVGISDDNLTILSSFVESHCSVDNGEEDGNV